MHAVAANQTQEPPPRRKTGVTLYATPSRETAFERPRDFLGNRFVYAVISSRARGLAVGVNLNPDKACNFNCAYCEVDRRTRSEHSRLEVETLSTELRRTLALVNQGRLRELPAYQHLPAELLSLRHVALSGDGEPTLAENFRPAVEAVVRVRALSHFFKIVLVTNGTGLDRAVVQDGLQHFTNSDEIWIKLDGGTQAFLDRVNRPDVPLEKILSNIQLVGRVRPVVIQSLFPSLHGEEPSFDEIREYSLRLKELKASGAKVSLVQIYSAGRPSSNPEWGHLPLRVLSQIAQTVRQNTGLRTEVF